MFKKKFISLLLFTVTGCTTFASDEFQDTVLPEQESTIVPDNTENNNDKPETQDIVTVDESTPSSEAKPITTPEKASLKEWETHLESLLVKDAFWDVSSQAPSQEWINEALDKAKALLTEDQSLLPSLKDAFAKSLNDKFLTIEKGTSLIGTSQSINDFNKELDLFVANLSGKNEEETVENNESSELISSAEDNDSQEQSESIDSDGETQSEEGDQLEQTKESDTLESLKKVWASALESLKKENTDITELDSLSYDLADLAKQLIEEFPDEKHDFYEQFLSALDFRKTQSLPPFPAQAQQKIAILFGYSPEKSIDNIPAIQESSPLISRPTRKQQQKKEVDKKIAKDAQAGPGLEPTKPYQPRTTEEYSSSSSYANYHKDLAKQALAAKIKLAAEQRAAEEKEKSERGILSSLAGSIFGESWVSSTKIQQNKKDLKLAQEKELDKLLADRIDLDTGLPMAQNVKDKIKTAYFMLEQNILSFSPTMWDYSTNAPLKAFYTWTDSLNKPLTIIIDQAIISISDIMVIFHETFKIKKLDILTAEAIEKYLQQSIVLLEKTTLHKRSDKKLKEEEEKKQIEAEQKERIELINRTEKEKKDKRNLKDKTKERMHKVTNAQAQQELVDLNGQWKKLLSRIENSKNPTTTDNNATIHEAIKIVKSIFSILRDQKGYDEKRITSQYKSELTKAFLTQEKNSGKQLNIYQNIELFGNKIHAV